MPQVNDKMFKIEIFGTTEGNIEEYNNLREFLERFGCKFLNFPGGGVVFKNHGFSNALLAVTGDTLEFIKGRIEVNDGNRIMEYPIS